jgi:hypothetical protein
MRPCSWDRDSDEVGSGELDACGEGSDAGDVTGEVFVCAGEAFSSRSVMVVRRSMKPERFMPAAV